MKQILREYGPITTLLVCSVLGYLWYDANREDVLAYSLDVMGQRLVEMVDDTSARASVGEAFGRFKERVMGGEVAPEDVETVAANVFNLRQQAARLTPEEAELVLQSAYVAVAESTDVAQALPSPNERVQVRLRPPRPKSPLAPDERAALSERLASLVAFQESISALPRGEQQETLSRHIHIVAEQGLRVKIDADLAEALPAEVYERVVAAVAKLERQRMVVWDPHLSATLRHEREQAEREMERLTEMMEREPRNHGRRNASWTALESLKKLEALGYRSIHGDVEAVVLRMTDGVDSTAVQEVVQQALEQAAAEAEAAVEAATETASQAAQSSGSGNRSS